MEGLPLDFVTATNDGRTEKCELSLNRRGTGVRAFDCMEQGGGSYVVIATSGDMTWTQVVYVPEDEDGCHVAQPPVEVWFELDAATAD